MKATELIEEITSLSMQLRSGNKQSDAIAKRAFIEAQVESRKLVKAYLVQNDLLIDEESEL